MPGAFVEDLRHALKTLGHSPVFSLSVALILAIGIGASASIFNLVDAYYLRPPAGVIDADRLVDVRAVRGHEAGGPLTYAEYAHLRGGVRALSGLMAYRETVMDLGAGGETRRVQAALVSSNYFAVLGAGMAHGRAFAADEERKVGGEPSAIISDRLWQGFFGADPDIVGKPLILNGRRFAVAGVAPPGFRGHREEALDLWVPLATFAVADPGALASVDTPSWQTWLTAVGRLAPDAAIEGARAEMAVLARQAEGPGSGSAGVFGVSLSPARPSLLEDAYAGLLIASVGALFLLACANLSNLFLARSSVRRREAATRLALGATPRQLVRLFLAESVLLSLIGGTVGLLIAPSTSMAMLSWSSAGVAEFPDAVDLHATWTLVGFVLGLSLVTGVLLGLGPALASSRLDVTTGLREAAAVRSTAWSRARAALVVVQIALSLLLLSAGGLLFETLRQYQAIAPVYEPQQVLLLSLQPSHQQYDQARAREFYRQLVQRVARLPGVEAASLARDLSVSDGSFFTERVAANPVTGAATASVEVGYDPVAPGYFKTMGVSLVGGRDFSEQDRDGAVPAAIVNETLARMLWPGASALGRQLWIRGERSSREVVGVARDRPSPGGPRPFLYEPLLQTYLWAGSRHVLCVRTVGGQAGLVPAVRREAAALAPDILLFNPRTLDRQIAGGRFFERLALVVAGGSGLLALLLAATGLYGVTRYLVSQRTREFAIRVSVGAGAGDVIRLAMRQAMLWSVTGTAIGLALALAANRAWASLLFRVQPADATVLAGVSLLLVAVMLAASYLPARQATKADPAAVLRAE